MKNFLRKYLFFSCFIHCAVYTGRRIVGIFNPFEEPCHEQWPTVKLIPTTFSGAKVEHCLQRKPV